MLKRFLCRCQFALIPENFGACIRLKGHCFLCAGTEFHEACLHRLARASRSAGSMCMRHLAAVAGQQLSRPDSGSRSTIQAVVIVFDRRSAKGPSLMERHSTSGCGARLRKLADRTFRLHGRSHKTYYCTGLGMSGSEECRYSQGFSLRRLRRQKPRV